MSSSNVDITVGNGTVTKFGWVTQAIAILSAVGVGLTSFLDALPEGVTPVVGFVGLVALLGVAAVTNFLVGINRGKFAEQKVALASSMLYSGGVRVLPSDGGDGLDDDLAGIADVPGVDFEEALIDSEVTISTIANDTNDEPGRIPSD